MGRWVVGCVGVCVCVGVGACVCVLFMNRVTKLQKKCPYDMSPNTEPAHVYIEWDELRLLRNPILQGYMLF